MKARYNKRRSHKKNVRGFANTAYRVFSLAFILIQLALPTAPIFADEIIDGASESQESDQSTTQEADSEASTLESAAESDTAVEVDVEAAEVNVVQDISVADSAVEETETEVSNTLDEADASDTEASAVDTEIENIADSEIGEDDSAEIEEVEESENAEETNVETEIIQEREVNDTAEEQTVSVAATTTVESDETDEVLVNEETDELIVEESTLDETVAVTHEEDNATTTEAEVATTTPESVMVNSVTNDENRYTFSKDECSLTGNGSYYCVKTPEAVKVAQEDRIFSGLDSEGDKEIYIEKEGKLITITENSVDDDAPYFDEVSNSLVWQRLVNERFQIMRYDIESGEEEQLTFDRYNNTQPSRHGDIIVWQGWVGDDWEVFKLEGDDLLMLTDNTTHDVSPRVNGNHIVWQSFESGSWNMKVYDIRTKEIQTVEGSDGASIENPRFVLVYDTKYESGDVETRGFDVKSGEMLDLGSRPAPMPEEIPDPEQTGEERALVSPVNQPKTKTSDEIDDEPEDPDDSVIDEGDIVIPSFEEDGEEGEILIDDSEKNVEVIVPLIIDSVDTSSSTPDHIEDLVIPPFEPLEEESHTQESIAGEA